MSIAFGILVILIGNLIKGYDSENIDYIFWIGTLFVFVLFAAIILVVQKTSKKTKEIKDL